MIMTLQLILGLGLLVFVHELGHFMFARLFGMRVEKFVIFIDLFDFKLFKFKSGETEYSMGWLPIGGYVKIAGMVDESMDKDQLKGEPEPWEFRSFPAWKRIIVLLGGVIVNIVVAVLIFAGLTFFGEKSYLPVENITDGIYAYEPGKSVGFKSGDVISKVNGTEIVRFKDAVPQKLFEENVIEVLRGDTLVEVIAPPAYESKGRVFFSSSNFDFRINTVVEGSPAESAGILPGDKIESIDDYTVSVFGDVRNILSYLTKKDTVEIIVNRDGEKIKLTSVLGEERRLGISSTSGYEEKSYSIPKSFIYGYKTSVDLLRTNLSGFGAIFSGKLDVTESLAGPIGIAKIYGSEFNYIRFWTITGLISLILAITNLIPIPALDGGQILIILVESLIGRELPEKVKMSLQMIGIVLVFGLLIFTVINDIMKF